MSKKQLARAAAAQAACPTPPTATAPTTERAAESAQPAPERERPIITALALAFVPKQGWTSIIYKIQGDKVLQVAASEPDLKLIAQEKFKVNMGKVIISEAGSIELK